MKPTKTTITLEIEVEVSGNHRRAEPDVGIMDSFFEDVELKVTPEALSEALAEYGDIIQSELRVEDAEQRRNKE